VAHGAGGNNVGVAAAARHARRTWVRRQINAAISLHNGNNRKVNW
jgi:hypothetical protein